MKKIIILALFAVFSLSACKPTATPKVPSAGSVDFSTYVAIGNSLTAGYASGSLCRSGQKNAYPKMLSDQFKLVGGGDFKQPLLPGNSGWPGKKLVLGMATDCQGNTSLSPINYPGNWDTAGSSTNISDRGPFNNIGVPGIRVIDYILPEILPTINYAALNPYAGRFYPPGKEPMDVALLKTPTFFTLWLGANDVLGYATAGGGNPSPGFQTNKISPANLFRKAYDTLVEKLYKTNADGVLINIPDVTSIPYFTTIDPDGLMLTQQQASALNAAYSSLGITFQEGANPFIIADANAPGGLRQIKKGEYILITIPTDSLKCGGWGSTTPIPEQYVLDASEVAAIRAATQTFNNIIAQNAEKYNFAFVDANAFLKTLQKGIKWNGLTFTPEFVTGGAFSLDGIHLTPRGYALMANKIIHTINAKYGATIPDVEVTKYNGLLFPG